MSSLSGLRVVATGLFALAAVGCTSGNGVLPGANNVGDGPGTATLTWVAPTSNQDGSALDLAGYKIYIGTAPGTYGDPVDIGMASCSADGADTVCTHRLEGMATGTWYFAAAAYSSANQESEMSNEATKTIL